MFTVLSLVGYDPTLMRNNTLCRLYPRIPIWKTFWLSKSLSSKARLKGVPWVRSNWDWCSAVSEWASTWINATWNKKKQIYWDLVYWLVLSEGSKVERSVWCALFSDDGIGEIDDFTGPCLSAIALKIG